MILGMTVLVCSPRVDQDLYCDSFLSPERQKILRGVLLLESVACTQGYFFFCLLYNLPVAEKELTYPGEKKSFCFL